MLNATRPNVFPLISRIRQRSPLSLLFSMIYGNKNYLILFIKRNLKKKTTHKLKKMNTDNRKSVIEIHENMGWGRGGPTEYLFLTG